MKRSTLVLIAAYMIAGLIVWPIARYLMSYGLVLGRDGRDEIVSLRVFFGGPLLIILGLMLALGFKTNIHRISGFIFGVVGLAWIALLVVMLFEVRI
jgi:hypothetical protein